MTTADHSPRRFVQFAGRRWWVKHSDGLTGPGPNHFDDGTGAVDVDPDGNLVMRIRRDGGRWLCAEVVGEEATGYGRYEWTIRTDLADLERHVVLGMFTWCEEPDQFNRELDIEVSAWSAAGGAIGQFVVQPAAPAGHLRKFVVPGTASWRCSFDWSPAQVTFRATDTPTWTFSGDGVPTPGGAQARINLWLHRGCDPDVNSPVTVTIGSFSFTPRRDGAGGRRRASR